MYTEYKKLDLPAIDREILEFWQRQQIFQKSVDQRDPQNSFVFYEGPPSANGKPGIHHVMARTVKDLFCRFHTMLGQRVERKAGWDTHGLPIELSVEKELGITKEDIGTKITVEEYNQKCRETVMRYKDMWDDLTQKMGYWVDLDHPYVTYENEYIESVWWLLKRLYDKNLLYKGYTVQPYSPAAGTGLSTHELNQPGAYREIKDTTVVAMFAVQRDAQSAFLFDHEAEDVRVLAWTTTPWTLPSNTALTVGPKIQYVKVKTTNPYTQAAVSVVLAVDLVGKWLGGKKQPAVIEQSAPFPGSQLIDLRYEQLLPFGNTIEPLNERTDAFRIIGGQFVTTEDGTGIVHTAPSFGADDRRAGVAGGIGALTLVDKQGKFLPTVGEFSNRYIKNYKDESDFVPVDIDIAVKLKKEGNAFNVAKYEHNYPHCWRTDKPILYYPLDSWFIKASAVKERMYELNQSINWKPASTGEGRFGKWLENLQDWNLSRSRYWGIPLPIWRSADGEREKCIGSIEDLRREIELANERLGLQQEVPPDLHRPFIDQIVLMGENGEELRRELDLIDVWFDSGSMPYAQWHYPFENQEKFAQNYPADFIAEGVDQTRGWFYTLHAIASMAFDSVAFKNVVSNGLVQAKDGRKMSKRLGNAVEPFETLAQYGADATRWYMISNAPPWDNLRFNLDGIDEVRRKFFGTLYNTYSFFALYANIDGFAYREAEVPLAERQEIDRWIISLLHSLAKEVRADYADYEATNATRKIQNFVDAHLSNWYVRLCRRRFWKGTYSADKVAAYQTLYQCLSALSKMMAPVAPFFADWLYRNLNEATQHEAHESVHLALFPTVDEAAIDRALEERMDYAQRISSLVLSLRKKDNVRVRQPLQKILLPVLDNAFQQQVEGVKDLILAEVNVKEIEYITDTAGLIVKKAKANFKTLGRKLGKHMKAAAAQIAQLSNEEINGIERTGRFELRIEEQVYELLPEDLMVSSEDIPGWQVASDGPLTVALDVSLNERLVAEGMARELVNRIQNLRKAKDFNVTDQIVVKIEQHEAITAAVEWFGEYVKNETLAVRLDLVERLEDGESIDLLEGISMKIKIERA
ncbi:MAG: isoleucine--tRNA ligase [Bacteroidota bacterium]